MPTSTTDPSMVPRAIPDSMSTPVTTIASSWSEHVMHTSS